MNTTSRNPESVSSVNMTPLAPRSLRTMCCTPADKRHLRVIEALVHAIGDRAVVEQRGEHLVHGLDHVLGAAHVEQRLLLTRERRLRQVLGGRRRAHGDGDFAPPFPCAR